MYFCKLCSKELKNIWSFLSHLRWDHPGITTKDYYDTFFKKGDEGICKTPGCSNQCKFENLTKGYHKHCSNKCTNNDPEVRMKIRSIWKPNPEKAKQTCLERYGKINVSQVEQIKKRKEKTFMKNFGAKCNFATEEHRQYMLDGGAAYCNRFIKNPSKPQIALFKLCQEVLPYPILNYPCLSYSIDIAVPQLNLAIEYDGSYWHQNREYDKRREEKIMAEGWNFIRYIDEVPDLETFKLDIKEFLRRPCQ